MTEQRSGILAGGNWIVDRVKIIDRYPKQDGLAQILEQSESNGGSPYNLLKDLAKLEAPFPLAGVGRVGEDEAGDFILEDCRAHRIDAAHIRRTMEAATSYTEVMTVRSTGRRTFFHQPGANRLLNGADFPLRTSRARILHLGYLLLLDQLDEVGADGLTGAERLFRQARSLGFKVSADVVSENSDRVSGVVNPALPAIDYFFLNELEAERITGVPTRRGERIDWEELSRAAEVLVGRGVRELACIHFPEGALVRTAAGRELRQASVALPSESVVGAVGAGDAFAAGVLFGVHDGWETERSLRLGVCAAASSLFHPASSQGVLPWKECLQLGVRFGFRGEALPQRGEVGEPAPDGSHIRPVPPCPIVPQAPIAMKTPGVQHLAIRSTDLERSKRFYVETLGFELRFEAPHMFVFRAGETRIGVRGPEAQTPAGDVFSPFRVGLDHVALACEDEAELERVATELTALGIENTGLKRSRTGNQYVGFWDPDGIKWEFYMA